MDLDPPPRAQLTVPAMTDSHIFIFGAGYTARFWARACLRRGWRVSGTTRSVEKAEALAQEGIHPLLFDEDSPSPSLREALRSASHLLISAGPDASGDPTLRLYRADIEAIARRLKWVGYLSTVGVYGDHNGAWIDETAPVAATSKRAAWRIQAEQAWLELHGRRQLPLHIFRLAGIYGPGRSPLQKLRAGTSRRIVKPGQVFNRIHVADIATTLDASIKRPNPGRIYNVTDGNPAPPQDVIVHAAELLGIAPPPALDFATAEMTPMARSFYSGNRRIANARIREELGVELAYPTYQEGLAAILAEERAQG